MTARNRTSETRTRRFFFDHTFLAVQPGATNLRISGPKGARVKVARQDRGRHAPADRLRLTPVQRQGRDDEARLRPARAGRGRQPAGPGGQQPRHAARLGVRVQRSPRELGRGAVPARLGRRRGVGRASAPRDHRRRRRPCSRPVPSRPRSTSSRSCPPQRPAVYVDRPLTVPVEGQDVELMLQAWKDDPGWADRTGSLFADALPVLRGDIGLPWPEEDPLVIHETAGRDPDASAGVFDPAQNRIDVAYWADRGVVIHQAAHGWFNGDLLADRWANEGFATFYALRAAEQLGESADRPQMTDEARAASFPLNAWAAGDGQGTATTADAYGYAASLELANALAERVGTDVLATVWADAAAGTGAYQPPALRRRCRRWRTAGAATPEGVGGAADWRALLDLLEARSGQDLTPLWREWVVRPDEAASLDARTAARASYGRTLAAGRRLAAAARDPRRAPELAVRAGGDADGRRAHRAGPAQGRDRDGRARRARAPRRHARPVRERVHGRRRRTGRGRAGRDRWRSATRSACAPRTTTS